MQVTKNNILLWIKITSQDYSCSVLNLSICSVISECYFVLLIWWLSNNLKFWNILQQTEAIANLWRKVFHFISKVRIKAKIWFGQGVHGKWKWNIRNFIRLHIRGREGGEVVENWFILILSTAQFNQKKLFFSVL